MRVKADRSTGDRFHIPPVHALPHLFKIVFVHGVGILNPADKADGTEKMKTEIVRWRGN